MDKKNFSKFMRCLIIFLYIFLALLLFSFFRGHEKNKKALNGVLIINNNGNSGEMSDNFENGNNLPIENIGITGEYLNEFSFIEDCLVENTGDYKILNVFSGIQKSPLDSKDYYSYTKLYKIVGNITDAKLCIVSDVIDYRKVHQYTYSTYVLFNESEYAGHLNVGYSIKTNVMYDKTTGKNPDLDGRFWGDETPKIYTLYDLNNVTVADTTNGGTKTIHILERLQKEGQIRIGGFVNAKNGEGRITKFILAYKCEEGNNCIIE